MTINKPEKQDYTKNHYFVQDKDVNTLSCECGTPYGCGNHLHEDTTKPEKQGKGWEERFDKEFNEIMSGDGDGGWIEGDDFSPNSKGKDLEDIKSFIQNELTKVKQEAYWEGIKVMEKEADRAIAKAKSETIQSVLACRPEMGTIDDSYDSALEEWSEAIKKLTPKK